MSPGVKPGDRIGLVGGEWSREIHPLRLTPGWRSPQQRPGGAPGRSAHSLLKQEFDVESDAKTVREELFRPSGSGDRLILPATRWEHAMASEAGCQRSRSISRA